MPRAAYQVVGVGRRGHRRRQVLQLRLQSGAQGRNVVRDPVERVGANGVNGVLDGADALVRAERALVHGVRHGAEGENGARAAHVQGQVGRRGNELALLDVQASLKAARAVKLGQARKAVAALAAVLQRGRRHVDASGKKGVGPASARALHGACRETSQSPRAPTHL